MTSPDSVREPTTSYKTPPLTQDEMEAMPPQIFVSTASNRNVELSLKSSEGDGEAITTTPQVPDDPQTPSLALAHSELTDRPPQKPLPLPKMRSNQQLFQGRSDHKRNPTGHTLMQSPSVAAIAAANYSQLHEKASFGSNRSGNTPPLFAVPQYPSFPHLPFDLSSNKHQSVSTITSSELEKNMNSGGVQQSGDGVVVDQFGRPICDRRLARLLLAMFVIFPPMWLLMGTGFLDEPVGVIPRMEKRLAIIFSLAFFCLIVVGIIIGFAVGLNYT